MTSYCMHERAKLKGTMYLIFVSLYLQGGPYWNVPTGRRDGRISNASEALANIPPPTSNFSSLQTSFASKGLDLKDLVLLSGKVKLKTHLALISG